MPQRVAVIGNGGGGKSTLSRALAARWDLPRTEVDAVQFAPDSWDVVDADTVWDTLERVQAGERWLIDGFGPLPLIQRRLELADTIVFIDMPVWVHFLWAGRRQQAMAQGARPYGDRPAPPTEWLFETLWRVHEHIVPSLRAWTDAQRGRATVHHLTDPEHVRGFVDAVCP